MVTDALARVGFVHGKLTADCQSVEPWDRATAMHFRIATSTLPYFVWFLPEGSVLDYAMLDISVAMFPPSLGAVISMDDLWNDRTWCADVPLPVPSSLHVLLDLCVNLYVNNTTLALVRQRRFRRMTPYLDCLLMLDDVDASSLSAAIDQNPTLARPVFFALGNLDRLFPGRVDASILDDLLGCGLGASVLDEVGDGELEHPYVWTRTLHDRMFRDPAPRDLPLSEWTLGERGPGR